MGNPDNNAKPLSDQEKLCTMYESTFPMPRGTRIMAVLNEDDKTIKLLGSGKYVGYYIHPQLNIVNPKMELDDGKVVWGCECWWGEEDKMKQMLQDRNKEIIKVDIDDVKAALERGE